MTAAKAPAKKPTPGPKPEFAIVEHTLKCQTPEGEVSLDLRIPLDSFDKLTQLEDMDEKESLPFIRNEVMPADVSKTITELRDGALAMKLIMKWIEAVGERFGASLGELGGSSDS
jgi:hypothetical protein